MNNEKFYEEMENYNQRKFQIDINIDIQKYVNFSSRAKS